jgi:hypothetical protein
LTIKRGKTDSCERLFRQRYEQAVTQVWLFDTHQDAGCTNQQMPIQSLQWLVQYVHGSKQLLWDLFSADRDQVVTDEAERLRINLFFVPASMIGCCQFLDVVFFGSFKHRPNARFERDKALKGESEATIEQRIELL